MFMPYLLEDIIIIIFRYLHRDKMKLLNQEYYQNITQIYLDTFMSRRYIDLSLLEQYLMSNCRNRFKYRVKLEN